MKSIRSYEILDYLKDKKYCSMTELMEHFEVSPATIHRDIAELTRKSLIRKVHGGVALPEEAQDSETTHLLGNAPDGHFSARVNRETSKKGLIANLALKEIKDGDIIFLDSSTTVLHLARIIRQLELANLTIITNSIHIIQEFYMFPHHFILVGLGGNYNGQLNSFLGRTTLEHLAKMKISKAFVSAVGATPDSVSTYHEEHAEFLENALKLAEKKYLLMDSSKFGKSGLFSFAAPQKFDCLFCDSRPQNNLQSAFRRITSAN